MKAIIKTDNKDLFYSLLQFLKSIPVVVETEEKADERKIKNFDPREYEGMLRHLNLDIENELKKMREGWKQRGF